MRMLTQRGTDEPRYDHETLQKVAALAERLQGQHQETLTATDIEAVGREVGLEPAFIHQALAQVAEAQGKPARTEAAAPAVATTERARRREFFGIVSAWGTVLAYAAFATAVIGEGDRGYV